MASYERYPILMSAEQYLFSPSCPVSVSRYQISGDVQTGKRLLQVRLLNLSRREVLGVYLRIVCLDEREQMLSTMRTVPMTGLFVPRGGVFGDEKIISLYSARTVSAQITVERVQFADGTTWNEPDEPDVLRIPAPVPVRASDTLYPVLEEQSRAAGVRNDVYFKQLASCWRCTCGVANSNWQTQCGYCGANREWLSAHMDAAQLSLPIEPAQPPEKEEPATPIPTVEPLDPSVYSFDAPPTYAPPAYTPPVPNTYTDAPVLYQPAPQIAPPTPAPKKKNGGKIVAIILVALVLLAAAGYFGYFWLMPLLRYQQAGTLAASGDYKQAIEIYTELGNFSDSAQQVNFCNYQIGIKLMQDSNYTDAFNVFKALGTYNESATRAAECLYSLGVLAYNDGDADTALQYVTQLESEYPSYEATKDLRECASYSKGTQAMETGDYAGARDWFEQANGYSDSLAGIQECDYQIAIGTQDSGDYPSAITLFEALGDYRDSIDKINACKYAYWQEHENNLDDLALEYLKELAGLDYKDCKKAYADMNKWDIQIVPNTIQTDTTTAIKELSDLDTLVLHCSVKGGLPDAKMKILMVYTLPDQTTGNTLLRAEAFASGESVAILWKSLNIAAPKSYGTIQLKFFDADTGDTISSVEMKYAEKK